MLRVRIQVVLIAALLMGGMIGGLTIHGLAPMVPDSQLVVDAVAATGGASAQGGEGLAGHDPARAGVPSGGAVAGGDGGLTTGANQARPPAFGMDRMRVARSDRNALVPEGSLAMGAARPGGGGTSTGPMHESAPYFPPAVAQAVKPVPGSGVRLTGEVDVGFTFQPVQYRGGAMVIANETGRPLAVSFHGPGCAAVRLNGQPVAEGHSYVVVTDIEIAGSAAVGVHVRRPAHETSESSPEGVG